MGDDLEYVALFSMTATCRDSYGVIFSHGCLWSERGGGGGCKRCDVVVVVVVVVVAVDVGIRVRVRVRVRIRDRVRVRVRGGGNVSAANNQRSVHRLSSAIFKETHRTTGMPR